VLRRRAVLGEQRAHELDEPALVGDRGIAARELLHHHRVGERIRPRPAERFRNRDAEEAERGHLGVQVGRERLALVERLGLRPDALGGEFAHRFADHAMAFGQQRRGEGVGGHGAGSSGSHFMMCSPTTASSPSPFATSTFARLRPAAASSSTIV
jgi:hypothetical protein